MTEDTPTSGAATQNEDDPEHGRGDSILDAVERAFAIEHEQPHGILRIEEGPPPDAPPPLPQPAPVGDLQSPDPAARRDALSAIADRPLSSAELRAVGWILLEDPDPELRWIAAETLAGQAGPAPRSLIERSLRDPDDRVRAASVRLAQGRGRWSLSHLIALATDRRWPVAQRVGLAAVAAELREPPPVGDVHLHELLRRVAAMDPPPLGSERDALGSMARSIGIERLADAMNPAGPASSAARLGAARLLLAEESAAALRRLALHRMDASPQVRAAAGLAAEILAGREYVVDLRTSPSAVEVTTPAVPAEAELIAALARALRDPEEAIRVRARTALDAVPVDALTDWVEHTLAHGSEQEAGAAGTLAAALRLGSCGLALLRRAAADGSPTRSPAGGALGSLGLDPAQLTALVTRIESSLRPAAVRTVWQVAGEAVLPALVTLLEDTAGAVRMAVLEVFEESGDASARNLAERLLRGDSSAAVRATAVHTLAATSPSTRLAALPVALADPDPDVRATAVELLPQGLAGESAGLLLAALEDPDDRVWQASLVHLASLPDRDLAILWSAVRGSAPDRREQLVQAVERSSPDRVTHLAAANAHSSDPADRALATQLAARAGSAEGTRQVAGALSDPDPQVRRAAATSMASLRSPGGVEALSRTLSDPQADVRIEAVRSLALIDDDDVPAILIAALKDPEVRVREMAGEALARWRSPAVIRRLAAALSAPDLRRAAGGVLERMGPAAIEPLIDVVAGSDADVAAAAGTLLDRIAGADRFVVGLTSTDPDQRLRSAEVLGVVRGPAAADGLLGALGDPDVRVRSRAAYHLGRLGDPRAVQPLKRMFLTDPVPEAAAAAETALRSLGVVPAGPSELGGEPPRTA
jgi:HEAT repeat protein